MAGLDVVYDRAEHTGPVTELGQPGVGFLDTIMTGDRKIMHLVQQQGLDRW